MSQMRKGITTRVSARRCKTDSIMANGGIWSDVIITKPGFQITVPQTKLTKDGKIAFEVQALINGLNGENAADCFIGLDEIGIKCIANC